jgi:hypothetical protein
MTISLVKPPAIFAIRVILRRQTSSLSKGIISLAGDIGRRWLERESNPRHEDFQSSALPTELPSRRKIPVGH